MAERAVGLARHAGEIGLADRVADERPDHLDRDFGIGPAGKAGDRLRLEPRPGFRHIEAAVAGKAREHGLGEAERRGLAPGRDVTQRRFRARHRGRKLLIFRDVLAARGRAASRPDQAQ